LTELEKLKAKDFISYIEKHKISKSDVIKLSKYYKNMQPTLGFAKSASYEQENIIPITKSYGFKMWSRSGLENAIQKCILITEGNYDEVISSVENPPPLARADSQEKKEEPVESSQVKTNKTSEATKPKSPKKSNTLGCFFTLMIFGALIYLGTGLFKGCESEATGNAVESKEIHKNQEKLNSVLELLKVRLKKENCRVRPLIIQSPYAANQNQSVYGTLTFRGSNLELEYSEQYFKTYESFILGRDSWVTSKGKLSNVNIGSMNTKGVNSPVLNGEWKSGSHATGKFKAFPVFNGDNNGNIYYELGTEYWKVWGYSEISNEKFNDVVDLMCQLADIKDPRITKNIEVKNIDPAASNEFSQEELIAIQSVQQEWEINFRNAKEQVTGCYDDLLKSQQEGFFWVAQMETTYSDFIDNYFSKIYYVCGAYEALGAESPDEYADEYGWMEYTGILIPNPSMNGPNVYVVDGLPVGEIEFYQKTDFDRNQFQGY